MRLGKFIKTPDEILRYRIEYSHWLDDGEYVSGVTFDTLSTNTTPLTFVTDTIGATDTSVAFLVSNGTDGETYEVAVSMTTSGYQVKQDVIYYVIKDIPVT